MPQNATPRQLDPVLLALAAIAALTLYRIGLLALSDADLFVDEAQYWVWGQNLDWGYYSKPPMIGWVLRAVTELAGSDAPFWIRLPGPVFHAATALILIGVARRLTDPVAAALVGLTYVSLPAVAMGSFLISTDTILLPFFAGAVWCYLILTDRPSFAHAVGLGVCIGLGFLSKYAAIYAVLCLGLGALTLPQARISLRDVAVAVVAGLLVISPNIIWNLQNDLMTVSHTADNVDWVKQESLLAGLNLQGAVDFLAAQFGVFGPVLFAAYILAVLRARPGRFANPWHKAWLVWLSVPILALVTVQALLSKAFANWAVTAAVGLVLLTVPVLWHRFRAVFWSALAVNVALCLALPIAATQTTSWARDDGRLVLRRFTGRTATSERVIADVQAQGLTEIVASHRHLLADLFHTAKGTGLQIYAVPPQGHPQHYYAQRKAYPQGMTRPFALVTTDGAPLPCVPKTQPFAEWTAGPGAFRDNRVRLYQLPPDCWD